MKEVDFIIVGGGLAGCCMALTLHERGFKVQVIANETNNCSRVAAGLFNPITGKMLTKTWKADLIFNELYLFYKNAETLLDANFFHEKRIYRPFNSIEEQNNWMAQSQEPGLRDFIHQLSVKSIGIDGIHDPFGGILLNKCGFVDTLTFMSATKKYFLPKEAWVSNSFNYDELEILGEERVCYQSYKARSIIFCEGTESLKNPFFNWVPIRPLKGETLTVQADFQQDIILNRGVYAVPQKEKNRFKIGATYDHKIENQTTTDAARKEIVEKWEAIATKSYQIIDQNWGLRPTSPDRKPIIGFHPKKKLLSMVNGLGTKGVSLAPFVSGIFADKLVNKASNPIYDTMDVSRYYYLYSKSL